uniref:Predicted protein n=1 Tax=Hordeum vulgare subsp. vulgare TaxID=112509 RepID=F2E5Q4_HORVV|nr:predicted protein [Hordeum vulgare subsp. vulgare]
MELRASSSLLPCILLLSLFSSGILRGSSKINVFPLSIKWTGRISSCQNR